MINNLIQKWNIKATIAFALVGFIVSLVIVIFKGPGFPEIILRPVFSGIIMAIFWNLCYLLLKKLLPDFTSELETAFGATENGEMADSRLPGMYDESGDFNFDLEKNEDDRDQDNGDDLEGSSENVSEDLEVAESSAKPMVKKRKTTAGSDEILVEGVPIKKDPELMARTIQHVLDTDKD